MRARREAAGGPVNCGLTNEKSPNAPGHHRARLKICHRLFMRVVAWLRPGLEPNEPVELKVP
jgi:hypothetical protein